MRLADASYPLLKSAANSKAFPAFTSQWEALVSQEKLASPLAVTVDAASDVLLSLPVDKVKRAFESVPGDACERIPVPSTLLKSIAQARGPNPTKVQAAAKQLEGVKGSASGRSSDDTICSLPRAALEDFALAVDLTAAQRLDESWVALKAALKFKDASEVATLERDLFTQSGSGMEREAFKKATAQYRAARIAEADLLAKRAAGPPKCFTIGCNVNYDYDLCASYPLAGRPRLPMPFCCRPSLLLCPLPARLADLWSCVLVRAVRQLAVQQQGRLRG